MNDTPTPTDQPPESPEVQATGVERNNEASLNVSLDTNLIDATDHIYERGANFVPVEAPVAQTRGQAIKEGVVEVAKVAGVAAGATVGALALAAGVQAVTGTGPEQASDSTTQSDPGAPVNVENGPLPPETTETPGPLNPEVTPSPTTIPSPEQQKSMPITIPGPDTQ